MKGSLFLGLGFKWEKVKLKFPGVNHNSELAGDLIYKCSDYSYQYCIGCSESKAMRVELLSPPPPPSQQQQQNGNYMKLRTC